MHNFEYKTNIIIIKLQNTSTLNYEESLINGFDSLSNTCSKVNFKLNQLGCSLKFEKSKV